MKGLPWYEARAKMAKKRINSLLDLMESPYFDMVQESIKNEWKVYYTHEEAVELAKVLSPVKDMGWSFKCYHDRKHFSCKEWTIYITRGPNNMQFSYKTSRDLRELLLYYIKDLQNSLRMIETYNTVGEKRVEELNLLTKNQIITKCCIK